MIVVSDFYDYYDSAIGFGGIDKTTVYNRKLKRIPIARDSKFRTNLGSTVFGGNNRLAVRGFYLGFCGEIFPGVQIKTEDGSNHYYNLESLIQGLKDHGVEPSTKTSSMWLYRNLAMGDLTSIPIAKRFFEEGSTKELQIFQEHGTPALLFENREIVINPRLKTYDFQKVKDPFTAFQEIHGFLSGVLGNPEKEMIEISDKDKAFKKGHGGKYSFRKPPKEKK